MNCENCDSELVFDKVNEQFWCEQCRMFFEQSFEKKYLEKIHPILDFGEKAYCTVWLPVQNSEEIVEKPFLITSNLEKIDIEKLPSNIKLRFKPLQIESLENRWSLEYMSAFLNGDIRSDIPLVFSSIVNQYKKYFELPSEEHYEFKALWDIATYFYPIFDTFPLLFLTGSKRCGKTKMLTMTSILAFNGFTTVSITEASTFRPIQYFRNTTCIDEIEGISRTEMGNLRDLLKTCYKKGLVIRRIEERGGRLVVKEFRVFAPLIMANTQGFEEILEDRGFSLIMERSLNKNVLNSHIRENDHELLSIRDDLYSLIFSEFNNVRERYEELLKNTVTQSDRSDISVISDTSVINNKINDTIDTYDTKGNQGTLKIDEKIQGRWLELSLPLLTIASLVSQVTFEKTQKFIMTLLAEKEQTDIMMSRDIAFLSSLLSYTNGDFSPISEIAKHFMSIEGEEKWITNDWVGRALRRLKVILDQHRTSRGREVRLNRKKIEELAQRSGLDIPKREETQQTLEEVEVLEE